ncbi:MAG: hypothetical protein Q4E51_03980 [Lachnospiraceae bacterium]|nr:hypothetical protein [Lachnospiraceae bacterium]
MALNPNEEMKMTYTSVVTKDNKPMISIKFERGNDICEGSVPECVISKNDGFTDEEIEGLEHYLRMNKKEIIEQGKSISGLLNIFSK